MLTPQQWMKSASAKGIPSRKDYGDLQQVQQGDVLDYVIQRHLAQRAGPHFDLRMGGPGMGLFSWASRKGVPHEPGEKTLAVRQPLHSYGYRNFEGEIPRGQYGGGSVSKVREGKLLITRSSPNAIHFTEASSPIPRRFILIKPKGQDQNWLLARDQIPEHPGVEKESYKVLQPAEAVTMMDTLMEKGVAEPKVDGALAFLRLAKGRAEIVSHRLSKRTGGAIPHTERMFGHVPGLLYPKKFEGRTFKGEIYGERKGKAIPPQELGGILNAGIARSLEKQKEQDVALRMLLFGQGSEQPYDASRAELEELLGYLPANKFKLPEDVRTAEEASRLLEQIQTGKHPLTREGMVIHPAEGGTPIKVKFRPEQDVFVRDVYRGEGKYEGVGAGGFRYSRTPEGPIVGNVGSGLSDELRRELLRNPELYFGRRARVSAQEAFPSGALRAPSLIALHEG